MEEEQEAKEVKIEISSFSCACVAQAAAGDLLAAERKLGSQKTVNDMRVPTCDRISPSSCRLVRSSFSKSQELL